MAEKQDVDRSIEELSVEEELHLKEDAMDAAPVGITISDPSLPDNPLIYVNDSFVELTGYERSRILGTNCRFLQGEETDMERVERMGEAVREEKPVAVELKNYTKDGDLFWNRIEIAPIRDETGEVTHFVGYQADVTDRKEAEIALAEEREILDHVLSRVTTLVPGITDTIVRSRSRESLETALVERFAAVEDFSGVWLGRYNPSTDRLSAVEGSHGSGESLIVGGTPHAEALARALEDRRVEVLSEPTGRFAGLGEAVGAVALIPLQYRDTVYDLLAVATPDEGLFDERETAVLGALGQAAGAAINALESSSLGTAETVTEVRLEITDPAMPLLSLAEAVDGEVTSDGRTRGTGSATSVLLSLAGVPGEQVAETVGEDHEVSLVAHREAGAVVEWTVPDGTLEGILGDDAVRVVSISATPAGARVQFEAASEHMANTVVGRLREAYSGVELLAFHEVPAGADSAGNFRETVGAEMTDRQLEALQKASVSGFFDWPRDVEGEQLAEAMDIHPSTFHQHLRAAERKLIGAFFDQ